MIQQVRSMLYRLLTCYKTRQRAIAILWFFILTAMHMVWMGEAIAADPNVPVRLVAGEPGIDEEDGTLFIAFRLPTRE
jgi:hypothetical protein